MLLAAAAAAGAAWIALAGWLRQWRGVNETISSLLLGYIAISLFKHIVEGPLRDPASLNKPSTLPLAEPLRFEPLAYAAARQDDPFDPRRVAPPEAAKPAPQAPGGARAGSPLLTRPLEDMRMVGTLRGSAGVRALVRIDGQVHAVAPGDMLGPNRGRIVRIDEQRIELRETVRTAAGQWAERPATLQMQGDTP
jgi:Tfp pilus assembly protein PilP